MYRFYNDMCVFCVCIHDKQLKKSFGFLILLFNILKSVSMDLVCVLKRYN